MATTADTVTTPVDWDARINKLAGQIYAHAERAGWHPRYDPRIERNDAQSFALDSDRVSYTVRRGEGKAPFFLVSGPGLDDEMVSGLLANLHALIKGTIRSPGP